MADGLVLSLLGQVGPWGLVTGGVVLIMTGRLIPRGTVLWERQTLQQRAEDWKAAHTFSEEIRKVQTAQLDELLDIARRLDEVMEARRPVRHSDTGDHR